MPPLSEDTIDFKPERDYDDLPASESFKTWLKLPINNCQRLFVHQAIKARPDYFGQLDEKTRRSLKNKNKKERCQFKLQEDETLIYTNDELIHPPVLKAVYLLLASSPTAIVGLGYILKIYGKDLCALLGAFSFLWAAFFLGMRVIKFFKTTLFLTNSRIGLRITIFWRLNVWFSSMKISGSVVYAGLHESTPISTENITRFNYMGVLMAIRNINDDRLCRYWVPLRASVLFLECLAAIVKETGGVVYISEFVHCDAQKLFKKGATFEHKFTDCRLQVLPDWFAHAKRALKEQAMNEPLRQLWELASFFAGQVSPPFSTELAAFKKQLPEDITFIVPIKCRPAGLTLFENNFACLTNQGFILTDKKMSAIKGFYPYSTLTIHNEGSYIALYRNYNHLFSIYLISLWNPLWHLPFRFPLLDALRLLGCQGPKYG